MILKGGKILIDGKLVSRDIEIIGKKIVDIGSNLSGNGKEYDVKGCWIIPGAVDVHAHLREPGNEHKETIATGTYSAAAGGITTLMSMPNVFPVTDTVEHYRDIESRVERDALVSVYPFAAVTRGEKGVTLADIEELIPYVKGFSDDGVGFKDYALLERAMELVKGKSIIASHAEAEGYGYEKESEYKAVQRELQLVKKTGVKYHFCHMSCRESFKLIAEAQEAGVDVTCEVTPHHLFLDESMIRNTNYKMNPPLRSKEDREATVEALLDGTATIIATDHAPHTAADKNKEYAQAANGIIGFETMLPLVFTRLIKSGIAEYQKLVDWTVKNPAERFNLPYTSVEVGSVADLAVLDIDNEREYRREHIISKSNNSPFIGQKLYGTNIMTVKNGKVIYRY